MKAAEAETQLEILFLVTLLRSPNKNAQDDGNPDDILAERPEGRNVARFVRSALCR
jgi:hypothetical protein